MKVCPNSPVCCPSKGRQNLSWIRQAYPEQHFQCNRLTVKLRRLKHPALESLHHRSGKFGPRTLNNGYPFELSAPVHDGRCDDQSPRTRAKQVWTKLGDFFVHRVRRRGSSLWARRTGFGIVALSQQRILESPRRRGIIVVRTHVQVNGINLLVAENAEVGQTTAAMAG